MVNNMEYIKENINKENKSILLLLCTSLLWSTGGFLIKLVDLNPFAIAGIRGFITSLVLLAVIKKPSLKFSRYKVLGAVAYTAMVISYVTATKMTSAANAILLQYTSPIYIAIFGGWLLKERASLKDWITIVFVVMGMVLFFFDDIEGGMLKGNIIAIFSGVALAFNTMFMRKQKDENPLENVLWGCILTVIVTLPFMFDKVPSVKSVEGLVLLGIFQLGLSYILYCKAIKKVTALKATFISLVEPLVSPVWVFLTIGEIPGKFSIIGGIVVLAAVTINCLSPKKRKIEETTSA
jgi:drug/metabolite transporter (DMT)-like permease